MCYLSSRPYFEKEFIGYKIVAKNKKTGKYYSIAIGFPYRNGAKMIERKRQKKLCNYFSSKILERYRAKGFEENMVGRTSAFVDLSACHSFYISIMIGQDNNIPSSMNFVTVIVKVKITEGLLSGTYGNASVVAGRRLTILNEVPSCELKA